MKLFCTRLSANNINYTTNVYRSTRESAFVFYNKFRDRRTYHIVEDHSLNL